MIAGCKPTPELRRAELWELARTDEGCSQILHLANQMLGGTPGVMHVMPGTLISQMIELVVQREYASS